MPLDDDINRIHLTRPATTPDKGNDKTPADKPLLTRTRTWAKNTVIGAASFILALTPGATTQDTAVTDHERTVPTYTERRQPEEQQDLAYHEPQPKARYADEHIPILMYHDIDRPENRYTVSPTRLRDQLDTLHDNDYYVVSLTDYITADFDHVPPGKQPVVITFDDASPTQFQLAPDGEPTRNSAAGILNEAFNEHDDFGRGAAFYISYAEDDHDFREPFGGNVETKTEWLQNNGFTIGYHSVYHADNEDATKADINEQTTILHALINDAADEPDLKHYAHPFGSTPERTSARRKLKDTYTSIVEAWGGLAPHPNNPSFNPHSIPRIETNAETFPRIIDQDTYRKPHPRNY